MILIAVGLPDCVTNEAYCRVKPTIELVVGNSPD
jgi:hypothetical protein